VVDHLSDLKDVDVLFSIVSTGKGPGRRSISARTAFTGHGGKSRKSSWTARPSRSRIPRHPRPPQAARQRIHRRAGLRNAKVIKAGKLSAVISGNEAAAKTVTPMLEVIAPQGVSYVGEGELARVCKIAHNVMLGVVIENLIEITLLANKMGVPATPSSPS